MKLKITVLAFATSAFLNTHAQQQSVTVGVYGGIGQKAITECVFKRFTAATGVRVVADAGASAVTLNKLVGQKAAPAMDVAYMDGGVSEQAWQAGVIDALDPTRIPNLNNLLDPARYQDGGKVYAASNGFYAFGIVYNKNAVKSPPKAWKDLGRPEFKGLIALPNAHISMGLPFLAHIATINGGSVVNVDPGINALKKMNAVAYFNSAGMVSSMLQSEEVAIAPHFSTSALELIKAGAPLEFVVPTDKAIGNDFRIHLVKNSPRREVAERLINESLTPAAAECLAEQFNAGPAIKGVQLRPEVARNMPWGSTGSLADLALPDWQAINAKRDSLVKTMDSNLTRR